MSILSDDQKKALDLREAEAKRPLNSIEQSSLLELLRSKHSTIPIDLAKLCKACGLTIWRAPQVFAFLKTQHAVQIKFIEGVNMVKYIRKSEEQTS